MSIYSYLKKCASQNLHVVVVITPPLPRDGGTARTAIQVHAVNRDVAAAPQTPQLGGPRPTLGAQVSLKLLFGYVTIFSSADLFTTDLNCRKKLACDIISECNVILSRRI